MVPDPSWRAVAPILVLFALAGCDGTSIPTCDSIEEDVIRLEERELIKIVKAREVSRTPREVTCRGIAVFRDGNEIRMRYRAYIDEDRDLMIAYDTKEAEAEIAEKLYRESQTEARRSAEQFSDDFDQQVRDSFGAAEAEKMKRAAENYDF